MKLSEVLDPWMMATRIDVLNKDKTQSTKNLVKLLKVKAKKRNPIQSKTKQKEVYSNHDGMTGVGTDTFDQNTYK